MQPPLEDNSRPKSTKRYRNTPTDELLQLPFLTGEAVPNSTAAYEIAKRANNLRVQSASVQWGDLVELSRQSVGGINRGDVAAGGVRLGEVRSER